MSNYRVISTKKLSPSLIDEAMKQDIEVAEVEMITVQPILNQEKWNEIRRWLTANKEYAVFTSQNAVTALSRYLNEYNSGHICSWKIFSLSGQTKKTLDQSSISGTIIATAENGTALAEKIIEHQVYEVLFFCGNKRRDELPDLLRSRNITVHEVTIYETTETPIKINGGINGIMFFSPSAVQSFFSINQLQEGTVCFAIGNTTADSIKTFTNQQIIISTSPSQESMVEAVIQYFQNIKRHE
jgi:uroporphyrinogen-III synthase